jgi:hypothetical protein
MRAVLVIVVDVFGEQTLHMALVHHDDVIEQIVPTTFNLVPTENSVLIESVELVWLSL